jgi:hypothetical protein
MKDYLRKENISFSDQPMLNVKQTDSSHFFNMIGIPIGKKVAGNSNYSVNRMPKMEGRFLETVVKGGPSTVRDAHAAIEKYMLDHMLGSPAVPFEILLTDRKANPDTSVWLTRVIYPSM